VPVSGLPLHPPEVMLLGHTLATSGRGADPADGDAGDTERGVRRRRPV